MSAVYRQGEDGVSVGSLRTPTPSKSLTREYKTMSYVKFLRCAYHFIVIPCYIKLFRANNPLIITLTALDKRSFTVQANLFKNKIKNNLPQARILQPGFVSYFFFPLLSHFLNHLRYWFPHVWIFWTRNSFWKGKRGGIGEKSQQWVARFLFCQIWIRYLPTLFSLISQIKHTVNIWKDKLRQPLNSPV